MLGESRDRRGPGDRAEGHDQMVIAKLHFDPVWAPHADCVPLRARAGDAPHDQLGLLELGAQGHDHVAGIERPARGPRQERRVEHEVGLIDHRHLRLLARNALQRAGRIQAAKTTTQDHDPCSVHASTVVLVGR